MSDKKLIEEGQRLNDLHIHYAQAILRTSFPGTEGLQNPLFQTGTRIRLDMTKATVQILFVESRKHWIVLSNILCSKSGICVYDLVYNDIDNQTSNLICHIVDGEVGGTHVHNEQKQEGSNDCGLFCIAIATSLLYKESPLKFVQSSLRSHLISCFENNKLVPFP